jgi:hypothetical protein
MRKLLLLFVLFCSSIARGQTNGWIESWNNSMSGQIAPLGEGYIKVGQHQVGWFGFGILSPTWTEFYAGPAIRITKWAEFDIGVGIEKNRKPFRIGSALTLVSKSQEFNGILENGGSGPWWVFTYNHHIKGPLGLGFLGQGSSEVAPNLKSRGIGPRIEYDIYRVLALWGASLIDWHGRPSQVWGVTYSFGGK